MKPKPPSKIMPRDLDALCDLYRYRYLTTSQLTRLRYPEAQITSRRCRMLQTAGYLARFQPQAVPGHGSSEFIHHLTKAGAELVASHLGMRPEEIPYPKKTRTPRHGWRMDHILSIVEFWICLDLAAGNEEFTVERFVPEWHGEVNGKNHFVPLLRAETPHPLKPSQTIRFLPDAAFILKRGDRSALFFLEADRATETVASRTYPDFTDKLLAYASYRQHDSHKAFGDFSGFRVLTTTLTPGRLESYQTAASGLGFERLFLFALAENVTPEAILTPVWRTSAPDADPIAFYSA